MDIRQIYANSALRALFKDDSIIKQQHVTHTYSTRNRTRQICNVGIYNKTHGMRTFGYLAIKIYNTMPCQIKTQVTFHHYMKLVNEWICNSKLKINDLFE